MLENTTGSHVGFLKIIYFPILFNVFTASHWRQKWSERVFTSVRVCVMLSVCVCVCLHIQQYSSESNYYTYKWLPFGVNLIQYGCHSKLLHGNYSCSFTNIEPKYGVVTAGHQFQHKLWAQHTVQHFCLGPKHKLMMLILFDC